jgi:hypothetical protein
MRSQVTLPSVAAAGMVFFMKSGFCASRNLRKSMARVSCAFSLSFVR